MSQALASDREPLARLLGDPRGEPGPSIQGWGPWKPCGTDVSPNQTTRRMLWPRELRFSISFVLGARLALWVSRQRAVAASGCSPGSWGNWRVIDSRGRWKPVSKSTWNCSECGGGHCRGLLERGK